MNMSLKDYYSSEALHEKQLKTEFRSVSADLFVEVTKLSITPEAYYSRTGKLYGVELHFGKHSVNPVCVVIESLSAAEKWISEAPDYEIRYFAPRKMWRNIPCYTTYRVTVKDGKLSYK